MAHRDDKPATGTASSGGAAVAELLPDPSQLRADASPASADDLIASIADQQIDALISESSEPVAAKPLDRSAIAAELAVQATQELQQMAQKLSDEARADLVADLNGAATEAMLKPIPEPHEDPPAAVAEATATLHEPTPPAAAPAEPDVALVAAPAVALDPSPPVGPASVPSSLNAEVNQAEIDALISRESPDVAESHSDTATSAAPHSSAEAVARELADDTRYESRSVPPIVETPGLTRAREAAADALMMILSWINFPVRNLSDSAREAIGIVAIITLVNAMSLLLYLMLFR